MSGFISKTATEHIKNKSLKPGFSYKDVWHEERAKAFTAAKAVRLDAPAGPHNAAIAAVENGQPFDTFKKTSRRYCNKKAGGAKRTCPTRSRAKPQARSREATAVLKRYIA
jgi:hypothetical protein